MQEAGFWATEWCPSTHHQTQILGRARQSAVLVAGLVELGLSAASKS